MSVRDIHALGRILAMLRRHCLVGLLAVSLVVTVTATPVLAAPAAPAAVTVSGAASGTTGYAVSTPAAGAYKAATEKYVHVSNFHATIDPGLQKDPGVSAAAKTWAQQSVAHYNALPYSQRSYSHQVRQTISHASFTMCEAVVSVAVGWAGIFFYINHCAVTYIRYIIGPSGAAIAAYLASQGFPGWIAAIIGGALAVAIGLLAYIDTACGNRGVAGDYLWFGELSLYCP